MKRIALTIACALASGIGGLALAQESPNMQPSSPPPSNYQQTPPQTTPPDTQSGAATSGATTSGAATSGADKRAQMKECMAQQEQQKSSTGMSKHDMKKYCKSQVKSSTESQPH